MGEIEEIIGINKDSISELKTSNKTSIMTSSTGKSLKRKHDDEHNATIIEEEAVAVKKLATEKMMGDKPEITITLKSKEAEVA